MNSGTTWFRRIFPRTHFEWREPAGFREVSSQFSSSLEKPWHKPLIASLVFLTLISPWIGHRLSGSVGESAIALPYALVIAISGSLAIVFFLPWLLSKCPVTIKLFEDQLFRVQGNMVSGYKFKDMDQYAIQSHDGFWILTLQSNSGRRITVGAPKNISPEEVATFLTKAGLKKGQNPIPINTPAVGMS